MELQSGSPKSTVETSKHEAGLEEVYADILQFGCLRIFRHFDLYLRGREELLITVRTIDSDSRPKTIPSLRGRSVWKNDQRKTNQRPLPPASPASSEMKQTYAGETLFLVGVYAQYKFCPYVWLRSQHSQMSSATSGFDLDVPLLLRSTSDWETNRSTLLHNLHQKLVSNFKIGEDLRVWDIVEELVDLNSHSLGANPFEVDFEALRGLPPMEGVFMAAAMASFLEVLLTRSSQRPHSYAAALKSDLRRLLERHFKDLHGVLPASRSDSAPASGIAEYEP